MFKALLSFVAVLAIVFFIAPEKFDSSDVLGEVLLPAGIMAAFLYGVL